MSRQTKPLARRILAKIDAVETTSVDLDEGKGWRNSTLILKAIENELDWLVISGEIVLRTRDPSKPVYDLFSLADLKGA